MEAIEKECKRKKRYKSEKEARQAALSQMTSHPETPDLDVYKCFWCSGWHLAKAKIN